MSEDIELTRSFSKNQENACKKLSKDLDLTRSAFKMHTRQVKKGVFMGFFKRIFLFLALNFLIVITASIVMAILMSVFDIKGDLAIYSIFYALIGFGGAFLSLAMSRWFAKKLMGVRIIEPNTTNPQEKALVEMVHHLARQARLPKAPDVGIYEKAELNAFATGPSKRKSLVAVSTGLLQQLSSDELEGVLGHEIAHIANGDMVTMTLLQGLINTMVLIAARMLAKVILSGQKNRSWFMEHMIFIGLQILFSILGSVVLCYFSRLREYRADQGGSKLAGADKMIAALKALQRHFNPQGMRLDSKKESYAYLQISGVVKSNWLSTHPPLADRIARLERAYS